MCSIEIIIVVKTFHAYHSTARVERSVIRFARPSEEKYRRILTPNMYIKCFLEYLKAFNDEKVLGVESFT